MARGVHPIERVITKLIELTHCDKIDWEQHGGWGPSSYELIQRGLPGKCSISHGWFFYYFRFVENTYTQGWRKSTYRLDELWKAIYWYQDRKKHRLLREGAAVIGKIECPDERLKKKPEHKVHVGGGVPPF